MLEMPTASTVLLAQLATEHIRAPVQYLREDGVDRLVFDPPLTAAEQAVYQRIVRLVRSAVRITPAEWQALEPVIGSVRTHRTRTNAEWSAMTAAQRDTALIDWCRNLTDVLRALLRD